MQNVNTINGNDLKQIDAPVLRSIVASGTTYVPTSHQTAVFGANCTITVGGNSIDILQGFSGILVEGVEYGFAVSTPLFIS